MGGSGVDKIRVLIVDDEPLARKGIRNHLTRDRETHVIGECGNGVEAVSAIENLNPDLVFLDIQMPELGGFEVIEAVGVERMPTVIFVTAYDNYTLQAFEVHALDYLLKPFETERFQMTLQRAKSHLKTKHASQLNSGLLSLLETMRVRRKGLERLVVRTSGRIYFVGADEIDWIEAADNYVKLHVGGKSHLIHETLTSLEQKLDPGTFTRIHRSKIINTVKIRELQPLFHGEYLLVLTSGERLTSGRSYRDKVRKMLENG
jgi:two-component system, LytTR family, response regulator